MTNPSRMVRSRRVVQLLGRARGASHDQVSAFAQSRDIPAVRAGAVAAAMQTGGINPTWLEASGVVSEARDAWRGGWCGGACHDSSPLSCRDDARMPALMLPSAAADFGVEGGLPSELPSLLTGARVCSPLNSYAINGVMYSR